MYFCNTLNLGGEFCSPEKPSQKGKKRGSRSTNSFSLLSRFSRGLDNRPLSLMLVQHFSGNFFAHVHFRFAVVSQVFLKFDDVEIQMIERGTHWVESVLRLYNELVILVRVHPLFLLLGKCAIP